MIPDIPTGPIITQAYWNRLRFIEADLEEFRRVVGERDKEVVQDTLTIRVTQDLLEQDLGYLKRARKTANRFQRDQRIRIVALEEINSLNTQIISELKSRVEQLEKSVEKSKSKARESHILIAKGFKAISKQRVVKESEIDSIVKQLLDLRLE